MRVCARYVPVVRGPRLPSRMAPPMVREVYPWERWTEGRAMPTRWRGVHDRPERQPRKSRAMGWEPFNKELYEEPMVTVAEALGVTKQRVEQLLRNTTRKLRSPAHRARVRGFLVVALHEMRAARRRGDIEAEWVAAQRVDDLTGALGFLEELAKEAA